MRRAALAAVLAMGCHSTAHPPSWPIVRGTVGVTIDPAFDAAERQDIEIALDAWNRAGVCASFVVSDGGRLRILRSRTWHALPVIDGMTSSTTGVWIGSDPAVWLVPDRLGPGEHLALRAVVAHELGHAIGLDHSDHGLMAAVPRWDALESGEIPQDVVDRARKVCAP